MIGQTILQYKILEKIGEGGMGEVYLAEDTKLERKAALKFLPRHLSTDPKLQARFQREAKAAASLNHLNIITVYEIGEHQGRAYIAMEYVDGHSLRELVEEDELPDNRILDISCQICAGLAYAHKAGIVHRDLKPENLVLDANGKVRILDFGLASIRGRLTSENLTLGTLSYMAPEYFEGRQVDHRADLWAVGVLLYEMFTGELPFDGEYEQTVIYSIVNEEPAPLQSYCPHLSGDFQKIIDRALQKHPDDRYQFASEIVHDLLQFEAADLLQSDANKVAASKDPALLQASPQRLKISIFDKSYAQPKTESAARMAYENPYPGLRPFSSQESRLFFGREGQSRDLLKKLRRNHFVAVVGASGSGKTSLIRAGVLPLLREGFMARAGAFWRIATFRPGNDPLGNMARALAAQDLFKSGMAEHGDQATIIENTLRRDDCGLLQLVRQKGLFAHENLLLVVDQFEELFRFRQIAKSGNSGAEAANFVALLLEATQQYHVPVYVILTMRSDFLGDCPRFQGLPEAINNSQYLVPRMTRDQKYAAICGPATAAGVRITPQLVQRLLNDTGDNPDQLPIMQHALMRTYDYWRTESQYDGVINLHHYEAIGGMEHALSLHADEAFAELAKDCRISEAQGRQVIAEKMFKLLTEKGIDNREVRRPAKLRDIAVTIGADEQQIIAVIEVFRNPGRALLTPPAFEKLTSDSLIDISHESLIRNWQRLKGWVDEEAQSAKIYGRLAETAILYEQSKAGVYHDPDLEIAHDWYKKENPNKSWAQRYHAAFEPAIAFLQHSHETNKAEVADREAQRRKRLRRTQIFSTMLGLAFVIALVLGIFANSLRRQADDRTQQANYNLAKVFEKKAGEAVDGKDYQKAWLYTLAALNKDIPADSTLPISKARLSSQALIQEAFRNLWTSPYSDIGPIYSVAISPDGKRLACGSWDHVVRIWDLTSGKTVAELQGHTASVASVAFGPNGNYLASGSADNTVCLWDAVLGKALAKLRGHNDEVSTVAFSPDGKHLASGSADKTVRLWEVSTGKPVAVLAAHQGGVTSVAFTPNGEHLASGSTDKSVRLWQLETGKPVAEFQDHRLAVTSVAISPGGHLLASGSMDKSVCLRELSANKVTARFEDHGDEVLAVAFSPDGRLLASGAMDNLVRLFEVRTCKLVGQLKGHARRIDCVVFSPNSERLASASWDYSVRLWDVATRATIARLNGHTDAVMSVAFSPQGEKLVSGSWDNTVRLWDSVTGETVSVLEDHEHDVTSVAFSLNGKLVVSGGRDHCARLWDSSTGRLVAKLDGHAGQVTCVAFSLNDSLVATGASDNTVRLWSVAKGENVTLLKQHADGVECVAFSPDGKHLATGAADHLIRLWNLNTGKMAIQLQGHKSVVYCVAFSPDGRQLASGAADNTIRLWNLASRKTVAELKGHTSTVYSVAFSPDGQRLASGAADNTTRLWNLETCETITELKGHAAYVQSVGFSPDGKCLASASRDNTIRFWDVATAPAVGIFKGHSGKVSSVAFSPDGHLLASGSDDASIRLWETASGVTVARLDIDAANILSVSFSPDSKFLAYGAADGRISLLEVRSSKMVATLEGHTSSVTSIAFSPDGKYLVSGSADKTVRLWNLATNEAVIQFKDHTLAVLSVAFSPDGRRIASGSEDKTVRLWNVATGKLISKLKGHLGTVTSLAFSSSSQWLASGSLDNTVRVWDANNGETIIVLKGHTHAVNSVAFSPDGKRLASASYDKSVRLWDLDTGESVIDLGGHSSSVTSIAFSADGQRLASGSEDGTIRLWNVRQREMPQSVEQLAKLYESSLYHFQSRLERLEFVPAKRPPDLTALRDGVFSEPGRYHRFRKLNRPRPLDREPIAWILENAE